MKDLFVSAIASLAVTATLCLQACHSSPDTSRSRAHTRTSAKAHAPDRSTQSKDTNPEAVLGIHYEQDVASARDWLELKSRTELAGGIEPSSAGIHLLYTSVWDPDVAHPSFPSLQEDRVRNWRFWRAKPFYDAPYTAVAELARSSSRSASCHIDRAVPNTVFEYGIHADDADGSYRVVARANARSLDVLRALLRDRRDASSGAYIDWYGIERRAGKPPSPLRLVVASNDLLYRPMNVTKTLEQVDRHGLDSYTFTVADELDRTSAATLKELLER